MILLALTLFPFFYAVYISLHKWKTTFPSKPFVGFQNYTSLLTDDERFINSIGTTLLIGVGALTVEFAFGLGMALLMWSAFRRVRWIAAIILLPLMISPVVVGFTARMAFTDSYGFVNQILSLLLPGDVAPQWLSSPTLAPLVIIIADAWQWGPFVFILLLAGLLASTGDEVEAGEIAEITGE